MIEEKDYEHIIMNNIVRTRILCSSERMTDGSMDEELSARALNKSRIRDLIYGKELKEIERLLTDIDMWICREFPMYMPPNPEVYEWVQEARRKCVELLR